MGNTNAVMWRQNDEPSYGGALFHALDVGAVGYLTIKDLMDAPTPDLMLPHSLPALYFFDIEKNGRITEKEFISLVEYCQSEKQKVEEALSHDKSFRDLILRASKAGVKDCSFRGRSSYRRLSSYSKVRSIFCSRRDAHTDAASSTSSLTRSFYPDSHELTTDSIPTEDPRLAAHDVLRPRSPADSTSSDFDDSRRSSDRHPFDGNSTVPVAPCVAMCSSQRETEQIEIMHDNINGDAICSEIDLGNSQNRAAVDVAVLENIITASIHKLADLLHMEGSREKFMAWLWELADFNSSGVVTLEELRVFLAALSEDGIDLEELAFHKEGGEPLEVCIINEFDTTHAGLLSRDEFMVLADLVTREYEFWENRHLERIGDYELGRTIGRGSSGVVRLAFHVENRQKFAIKIIKKGKCSDLSRLDREIQSLMSAKHKHIVELEEVLESDNNIFIVMELCGGGSMVDIVRLYPEERMPEETARFFMRQVFEALAFCHGNGICHRDVRLDNLMLDNRGNVKLTDFGHSGMYTPGWDIFSTSLVGSVHNLSPEQLIGQVYSGEKIDIWSVGVAVYCLLIGHPPFYDPDVNLLLQRIAECSFEVPGFVSEKASDLIECMIRANPEERIPMYQMLHHPWFYDGPEYGPCMNVVAFPVDAFYKKRPDIAEMILAMTIYQHNLHFHLADTHNPKSSPDELRGQDWTLRCLCPRNDIKFTVSLFTKAPQPGGRPSGLTSRASSSALIPQTKSGGLKTNNKFTDLGNPNVSLPDCLSLWTPKNCTNVSRTEITGRSEIVIMQGMGKASDSSAARPPLQKRAFKVTPMGVAAHIRASSVAVGESFDPFDVEPEQNCIGMAGYSFQEDWLRKSDEESETVAIGDFRKERRGYHSRSHSLDGSVGLRRINRSATVDAFPYQKVYPQREMPEIARNLDFGKPDGIMMEHNEDDDTYGFEPSSAPITPTFLRNGIAEMDGGRSADMVGVHDGEIAIKLVRHPSKTVSPQSPQVDCVTDDSRNKMGGSNANIIGNDIKEPGNSANSSCSVEDKPNHDEESMQPFIEVRLQNGESGLFLKICRKLKTICSTKLTEAAERQRNKKSGGRRSLTTFRRTASARSIGSELDVTTDGIELSRVAKSRLL